MKLIPLPTSDEIRCLQWMLNLISSMSLSNNSCARWDQWLRYEFGDTRANNLIKYLRQIGIEDPKGSTT